MIKILIFSVILKSNIEKCNLNTLYLFGKNFFDFTILKFDLQYKTTQIYHIFEFILTIKKNYIFINIIFLLI